jgi:PAS domain S-box-containing protein
MMNKAIAKISEIKNTLINSFVGGLEHDHEERRKRINFVFFVLLSIPIIFYYSIHHFNKGNSARALFLLLIGVTQIISLLSLRDIKKASIIFGINFILLGSELFLLMISGGEIGSGILWMFILPPFVFFLLGKKDGLLLGILTFVLSLFFLIDPYHIIGTFPYAAAIKAEFLAIYGVTVLMAYSVESARQRYQEGMESEQLKLQSEIRERIRAEEELSNYRHHLEESVQQRTSELTVANEELMIEAEERKRAEEILRDREEKYRTLFEESRDTIYITTPEGKFIDINQVGLEFFGYTKEELMNLNAKEIYVDPDDRLRFRQKIEREGFVRDYETKFRKKDGTEMDCLLTSTLRQAIDGSILGYQGIIRDITGRRRSGSGCWPISRPKTGRWMPSSTRSPTTSRHPSSP